MLIDNLCAVCWRICFDEALLQDGLTGSAWGDWANYTASPLRAFENELGVQAPTGFWDPAGFTADGSVENFKRRRQTELKHGRISMLATMGYITPETWLAFLSVTRKALTNRDIPSGKPTWIWKITRYRYILFMYIL